MANTTWILVANASLAKIYANHGPKKGLEVLKELEHPESRQKNADLVTDRPRIEALGQRPRQPGQLFRFEPAARRLRVEPRVLQRQCGLVGESLRETDLEFNHGRSTNQFERAILVAPPSFMGLINDKLDGHTASLVSDRFEKDYTKASEKELTGHLGSCIRS